MEEDPNARDGPGRTALHLVCSWPDFSSDELSEVRSLLQAGADPDLKDPFERAALPLLCMHSGHFEAARALLAAGASPSSQDAWGRTPLHWCCDRGWLDVAQLLLDSGAGINITTKQGDSPLLWAAKAGNKPLVELLLNSGCNLNAQNNRRETAMSAAGNDEIRSLISSAEALDSMKPEDDDNSISPPSQELEGDVQPSDTHAEGGGKLKTELGETTKTSEEDTLSDGTVAFSQYSKEATSSGSGTSKKLKITLKKRGE